MRLTEERMPEFGAALPSIAAELALAGNASPLLKPADLATWGNRTHRAAGRRESGRTRATGNEGALWSGNPTPARPTLSLPAP